MLLKSASSLAWRHIITDSSRDFAKVASPSHALTRKGVTFAWNAECEAAFKQLKSLLIRATVLAYPQFGPNKRYILETRCKWLWFKSRAKSGAIGW